MAEVSMFPHSHPTIQQRPPTPAAGLFLLFLLLFAHFTLPAATIETEDGAYFPLEPITVHFSGGPGNAKDWIGMFRDGVVPGPNTLATVRRYTDGTTTGNRGVVDGSVTIPNGPIPAGGWVACLMRDGGYSVVASNRFRIVENWAAILRIRPRTVGPGERFEVSFRNGPSNPRDWIGLYGSDQTPGIAKATAWGYTDGTGTGLKPLREGSLAFPAGLNEPGDYVAYLLFDDGYEAVASETVTVVAPDVDRPRILARVPAGGATNQPPVLEFSVTFTNGISRLDLGSVRLELDGVAVVPTVTSGNGLIRIRYVSSDLPAPGSKHTWKFVASDDATPPHALGATSDVIIGAYRNIVLPDLIHFETFDNVPEGSTPAGWTSAGQAIPVNDRIDFGDLGSAAYAGWTAVDAGRFAGGFVTYGDPSNPPGWGDDYRRVLSVNRFNVRDGRAIDSPLARGHFLIANSGYHNPSESQVLHLFTPDFDLGGRTDVHVAFHSLWEQNQDSLAALEYSVDRGASWLPVAYLLEDSVIVRTEDGGIDAVATFNTPHDNVARYTDGSGAEVGGTFGSFLAAPVSPALAPFIQGRINDDPVESKRLESYRLPLADGRSSVRLRFTHAGTDSWYWGIDDFGIYGTRESIPEAPVIAVRRVATDGLEITFDGVLQSASNSEGPFLDVPGAVSPVVLPVSGEGRYFRARR